MQGARYGPLCKERVCICVYVSMCNVCWYVHKILHVETKCNINSMVFIVTIHCHKLHAETLSILCHKLHNATHYYTLSQMHKCAHSHSHHHLTVHIHTHKYLCTNTMHPCLRINHRRYERESFTWFVPFFKGIEEDTEMSLAYPILKVYT